MAVKRWVVGISGASGAPLAVELLKALKVHGGCEIHTIVTSGGEQTLSYESGIGLTELGQWSDKIYDNGDIGAPPASGSWRCEGMVIVPCSMKTVAGIASGYSDNLLLRAADVMLKERRRLVLVTRECPLSPVHLRNMLELCRDGATILPPVMSFYGRPETLEDMVGHVTGKIMDSMGIDDPDFKRWGE